MEGAVSCPFAAVPLALPIETPLRRGLQAAAAGTRSGTPERNVRAIPRRSFSKPLTLLWSMERLEPSTRGCLTPSPTNTPHAGPHGAFPSRLKGAR